MSGDALPLALYVRRFRPQPSHLAVFSLLVALSLAFPLDAQTEPDNTPATQTNNDDAAKGQQLLDQAFEKKLTMERMSDFDEVIELINEALESGLDEGTAQFARELASSTLVEKANQFAGPLVAGNIDAAWAERRRRALAELEKAVELNPNAGDAHLMIAQLQGLPGGDAEKGKAAATKAVKLLANDSDRESTALVVLARYTDVPAERIALYDRAIVSNDRNAEAWRERGRAKFEEGEAEAALQDLRHLLEMNADDVETLQVMAALFASQENYDEALKHATRMIEVDNEQPGGYVVRSRIYMAKGDNEKAEEDLNKVLEIEPRDPAALLLRARLRQAREANEEALADVNRVLQLRPGLPQAVLMRSFLYVATNQFRQAIADVRALLQSNPENLELQLQLAGIYLADDRPTLAIEAYNRVLEKDAENFDAIRGRADAYLSLGKHAEAVQDYEKVLADKPEHSGVLNNFAWVLATSPIDAVRNGNRAIELATRACEATEYKAAHILSTLAAAYAEVGDFENAKKWSQKAIELSDDSIKDQLRDELKHYEEGKPFREVQDTKEKDPADLEVFGDQDLKLESSPDQPLPDQPSADQPAEEK